jgi:hypothetical protein
MPLRLEPSEVADGFNDKHFIIECEISRSYLKNTLRSSLRPSSLMGAIKNPAKRKDAKEYKEQLKHQTIFEMACSYLLKRKD